MTKNKNIFKIIALVTLIFSIVNCKSDDLQNHSLIEFEKVNVTLTSELTTIELNESEIDNDNPPTYLISATIANPAPVDIKIPFKYTGGDPEFDFDFEMDPIVIPAHTTSGSTELKIFSTGDIEGNESFSLIPDTNIIANANVNNLKVDINITDDYINNNVDLTMDWSGSFTFTATGGTKVTVDYCSIDFDLYLFDSDLNSLGPVLGTADCPENDIIGELTDGDYFLVVDLFENPISGLNTNQPLPITLSWNQEYIDNSGEIVYDQYTTNDSRGAKIIAKLNVSNNYIYKIEAF